MKGQKFFYFLGFLLEGILLMTIIMVMIPSVVEDIAEGKFGISIPDRDLFPTLFSWGVSYIGILVMLHRNFPRREDSLFVLMAIAIIELVKGSNILFTWILPAVDWGKTGDLLAFLGGLALLSIPVLVIFFYGQIHKLFVFEEDEEADEIQEGEEEKK